MAIKTSAKKKNLVPGGPNTSPTGTPNSPGPDYNAEMQRMRDLIEAQLAKWEAAVAEQTARARQIGSDSRLGQYEEDLKNIGVHPQYEAMKRTLLSAARMRNRSDTASAVQRSYGGGDGARLMAEAAGQQGWYDALGQGAQIDAEGLRFSRDQILAGAGLANQDIGNQLGALGLEGNLFGQGAGLFQQGLGDVLRNLLAQFGIEQQGWENQQVEEAQAEQRAAQSAATLASTDKPVFNPMDGKYYNSRTGLPWEGAGNASGGVALGGSLRGPGTNTVSSAINRAEREARWREAQDKWHPPSTTPPRPAAPAQTAQLPDFDFPSPIGRNPAPSENPYEGTFSLSPQGVTSMNSMPNPSGFSAAQRPRVFQSNSFVPQGQGVSPGAMPSPAMTAPTGTPMAYGGGGGAAMPPMPQPSPQNPMPDPALPQPPGQMPNPSAAPRPSQFGAGAGSTAQTKANYSQLMSLAESLGIRFAFQPSIQQLMAAISRAKAFATPAGVG